MDPNTIVLCLILKLLETQLIEITALSKEDPGFLYLGLGWLQDVNLVEGGLEDFLGDSADSSAAIERGIET